MKVRSSLSLRLEKATSSVSVGSRISTGVAVGARAGSRESTFALPLRNWSERGAACHSLLLLWSSQTIRFRCRHTFADAGLQYAMCVQKTLVSVKYLGDGLHESNASLISGLDVTAWVATALSPLLLFRGYSGGCEHFLGNGVPYFDRRTWMFKERL